MTFQSESVQLFCMFLLSMQTMKFQVFAKFSRVVFYLFACSDTRSKTMRNEIECERLAWAVKKHTREHDILYIIFPKVLYSCTGSIRCNCNNNFTKERKINRYISLNATKQCPFLKRSTKMFSQFVRINSVCRRTERIANI